MTATSERTALLSPESERPRSRTSLVIVVWNAKKYVFECLSSLCEYCEAAYNEVIIVDNASADGTGEYLGAVAAANPHVRVMLNDSNRGFAPANNQAQAQARTVALAQSQAAQAAAGAAANSSQGAPVNGGLVNVVTNVVAAPPASSSGPSPTATKASAAVASREDRTRLSAIAAARPAS